VKAFIMTLLAIVGISVVLAKSGVVVFNWTDSEPRGLYRLKHQSTSDNNLGLICLTTTQEFPAISAGLNPGRGSCPSGFQPFLKRIYRPTPEHPLVFDQNGFWIDGHLLKNTRPLLRGKFGITFPRLAYGRYTDGVFAISDYHPRSYDSRYFGPIRPDQVVSFAAPLLVVP